MSKRTLSLINGQIYPVSANEVSSFIFWFLRFNQLSFQLQKNLKLYYWSEWYLLSYPIRPLIRNIIQSYQWSLLAFHNQWEYSLSSITICRYIIDVKDHKGPASFLHSTMHNQCVLQIQKYKMKKKNHNV